MKFSDALSGLASLILGIAVIAYARSFPAMPGQAIGPALFPAIVGFALAVLGSIQAVSGLRKAAPWMEPDEWLRKRSAVLHFVLVFAALLFYALAAERLGFFITGFIFLGVLWAAFGVPRKWIAPLALLVVLALHYAFYSVLRVPLPWGLLGGIAW
jgi:putative tricarboxylic transport membrane protein